MPAPPFELARRGQAGDSCTDDDDFRLDRLVRLWKILSAEPMSCRGSRAKNLTRKAPRVCFRATGKERGCADARGGNEFSTRRFHGWL